jgi:hypothetical protein
MALRKSEHVTLLVLAIAINFLVAFTCMPDPPPRHLASASMQAGYRVETRLAVRIPSYFEIERARLRVHRAHARTTHARPFLARYRRIVVTGWPLPCVVTYATTTQHDRAAFSRTRLPPLPIAPAFAVNTALFWLVLRVLGRVADWMFFPRVPRRRPTGRCPQCDYDLRFTFDRGCPECGWQRTGAAYNPDVDEPGLRMP